jgi:parallel beta-helix repeat protein
VSGFTLQNSGNVDYNDAGIHYKNWGEVPYSNNNKIIGNIMVNNYDGIFGIQSENNSISDNIIIDNRHCGIFFQAGCELNIIQNNAIKGNDYGVSIQDTNYVQVIRNTIENNKEIGVYLFGGADLNDVTFNYIFNNSYGIVLSAGPYGAGWNKILSNTIANNTNFGLYLEDAYWCKIHKNNFINNNVHASFFYTLPIKILSPFFGHFLQMNKFYRNYWDDKVLPTPKVIQGEMYCFEFLSLLYLMGIIHTPIEPKIITWRNFDWFPTLKPYEIE